MSMSGSCIMTRGYPGLFLKGVDVSDFFRISRIGFQKEEGNYLTPQTPLDHPYQTKYSPCISLKKTMSNLIYSQFYHFESLREHS